MAYKMKKTSIFFFILCCLTVLCLSMIDYRNLFVFQIKCVNNDIGMVDILLPADRSFHLETIHSVSRTPYIQTFRVDRKGDTFVEGATFESAGGGYPVHGDGKFSYSNGRFVVQGMNRFVGKLRFRVSPVSRETLRIGGIEVPIYAWVPEGTLMEIQISRHLAILLPKWFVDLMPIAS